MPDPILVGRDREKIQRLAEKHHITRWTTDLDAALANPDDDVFFDAGTTQMRAELLEPGDRCGQARLLREAGVATTSSPRWRWRRRRRLPGIKHGVVQDKLFLPGLLKLKMLQGRRVLRAHLRGARRVRLLGVRGRLGQPAQRPSVELPQGRRRRHHPRYALPLALRARQPVRQGRGGELPRRDAHPERVDERGKTYAADADDAAYATFQLEGGVVAHINSSWDVRVRRDDLVTFQVDGTHGSAVAGLHKCFTQHRVNTPKPVWNPDMPQTIDFFQNWEEVPDNNPAAERLQGAVGDVPPPCRRGRALGLWARGGRQGRAARDGRAAVVEGAALAGHARISGI